MRAGTAGSASAMASKACASMETAVSGLRSSCPASAIRSVRARTASRSSATSRRSRAGSSSGASASSGVSRERVRCESGSLTRRRSCGPAWGRWCRGMPPPPCPPAPARRIRPRSPPCGARAGLGRGCGGGCAPGSPRLSPAWSLIEQAPPPAVRPDSRSYPGPGGPTLAAWRPGANRGRRSERAIPAGGLPLGPWPRDRRACGAGRAGNVARRTRPGSGPGRRPARTYGRKARFRSVPRFVGARRVWMGQSERWCRPGPPVGQM